LFDNLLANAMKYSPDGGPIGVQLAVLSPSAEAAVPLAAMRGDSGVAPRWVQVRISDTGLGIPSEAQPYVFDRFWRAEGPTRHLPGSGLGLYTSRAIVAAHGGHIWIERSVQAPDAGGVSSEWHGTVIAVALPIEAQEERADVDVKSTT
jgi:OmpR-family two-component system manganese-sensing sensor histidine kinase